MQLLYVVELELSRANGSAYDSAVGHLASWLSRGSGKDVAATDLARDGSRALPPVRVGDSFVTDRRAVWETSSATDVRAVRAEIVQPLGTGVELTTRVTISDTPLGVKLRVGMSREHLGGALNPVAATSVFQPSIVELAARDESLILGIGAQRIDRRYALVRTETEAAEVVRALRWPQRLPILLVHARSNAAYRTARYLAHKLIGLVRVVVVSHLAAGTIASAIPGASVPFAGARLVWSDLAAPGITLPAALLNDEDGDTARAFFMERLAPVSALARGIDQGWRDVRQRVQVDARAQASEYVQLAANGDDLSAVVTAQSTKIELLEQQVTDADEIVAAYADEAEQLREQLRATEGLEAEAKYWREQFQSLQSREVSSGEEDPWATIPVLSAKADPADTFLALEDASGGRIVFTDAASRSWRKIDYPDPEDMTQCLIALARASTVLYGPDELSMGRLDDWFKVNFALNVATTDDTIQRSKRLRDFDFEGRSYDQTPHVKVRDAVKPNEVGRIHFALDKPNNRMIVNHVALKLYGI